MPLRIFKKSTQEVIRDKSLVTEKMDTLTEQEFVHEIYLFKWKLYTYTTKDNWTIKYKDKNKNIGFNTEKEE